MQYCFSTCLNNNNRHRHKHETPLTNKKKRSNNNIHNNMMMMMTLCVLDSSQALEYTKSRVQYMESEQFHDTIPLCSKCTLLCIQRIYDNMLHACEIP